MPLGPWYTPLHRAAVRMIHGAVHFITDSEECCCISTTTTTEAPTTTTVEWGPGPCPTPEWCDAYCGNIYYAVATTGQCTYGTYCDDLYAMVRDDTECGGGTSCVWFDHHKIETWYCKACIECSAHGLDDHRWFLSVGNPGTWEFCRYSKAGPVLGTCPAGVYAIYQSFCDDCAGSITVYT